MHVHRTSVTLEVCPVGQGDSGGEEAGETGDSKSHGVVERHVRNLGFFLWAETLLCGQQIGDWYNWVGLFRPTRQLCGEELQRSEEGHAWRQRSHLQGYSGVRLHQLLE